MGSTTHPLVMVWGGLHCLFSTEKFNSDLSHETGCTVWNQNHDLVNSQPLKPLTGRRTERFLHSEKRASEHRANVFAVSSPSHK